MNAPTWTPGYESKRFKVDKLMPDGTTETIYARLNTSRLTVTTYGEAIVFQRTNRGTRIRDMRDEKLKEPSWVKKELQRLLGWHEAEFAFIYLTTV